MEIRYEIELANNGMIVRRPEIGEVRCIEYIEKEREISITPVANFIGEDILDDMLESPDMKEEIHHLCQRTGEDGINNFEIIVKIKPVVK